MTQMPIQTLITSGEQCLPGSLDFHGETAHVYSLISSHLLNDARDQRRGLIKGNLMSYVETH